MWFFLSPKIVFGEEALQELSQLSGKRAFIVTDETMLRLGYVGHVQELLSQAGLESHYFAEVEPDPSLHTVYRCSEEMNIYAPDWVIGLGGGSALDAAKAAWFLYERPDVPLDAINPFEVFGLRAKARFVTIATTSGTGADVSWGFALNDTDQQAKLVRVSRELIPDLAIVDPAFVSQLPPGVTADAGMDVLAHAVEAFTNNWHNDFTDPLALQAIRLVFTYLPRAYRDGSDREAREHMHNASTIAGLAFSNTAIILAHALAHAFGARFHTHHGRTVGVFLPYTIEFNAQAIPDRYTEIAKSLELSNPGAPALAKAIRSLAHSLDQPISLAQLGVEPGDFSAALPEMLNNTLSALELIANPRPADPSDLERLFIYAFDGRPVDF
jgi:alcohol dehydrogenase class IV